MSIVVQGLKKSYGKTPAVRDVSFEVSTGSLFAFLGTNGAGKSTTIGCITTVLKADEGEIFVDGKRVGENDDLIRREIGVVFQTSLLDPLLTVRENLALRAGFYGFSRSRTSAAIDEISKLINLEDFLNRRYGKLSGGQRRRADIARALIHNPAIVFLDEPTSGLDPQSREQVWSAIQGLRQSRGATIFLTTHYMEETEAADSVCIIDDGQVVAEGTPAELRQHHSPSILTLRFADQQQGQATLSELKVDFRVDRNLVLIAVTSSAEAKQLLTRLDDNVDDFEFRHGTMDDVFLTLTNQGVER